MKYLELENTKIKGAYDSDINKNIPETAIEVSEEIWLQRLNDSSLNAYENGELLSKDFRTEDEILIDNQAKFRAERDALLAKCDIAINIAMDNNLDTLDSLKTLRQALRNSTVDWVLPDTSLLD